MLHARAALGALVVQGPLPLRARAEDLKQGVQRHARVELAHAVHLGRAEPLDARCLPRRRRAPCRALLRLPFLLLVLRRSGGGGGGLGLGPPRVVELPDIPRRARLGLEPPDQIAALSSYQGRANG